jgi:hypothetical protein
MEKRNDGVSFEQTALGLIQIVKRVARRGEYRRLQSELPSGFAE